MTTEKKSRSVKPKVVEVGSVTQLVGENINLKKVADYALMELELKLEDAANQIATERKNLSSEIEKHYRSLDRLEVQTKQVESLFKEKVKQACQLFGITDFKICVNNNNTTINHCDESGRFGGSRGIQTLGFHIGVINPNEGYTHKRGGFQLEIPVDIESLEGFETQKEYNKKSQELSKQWDDLSFKLKEIDKQKLNLKTDGKRLHLEVIKKELSKNDKGKALMTELCGLINQSSTAKFLGYTKE